MQPSDKQSHDHAHCGHGATSPHSASDGVSASALAAASREAPHDHAAHEGAAGRAVDHSGHHGHVTRSAVDANPSVAGPGPVRALALRWLGLSPVLPRVSTYERPTVCREWLLSGISARNSDFRFGPRCCPLSSQARGPLCSVMHSTQLWTVGQSERARGCDRPGRSQGGGAVELDISSQSAHEW